MTHAPVGTDLLEPLQIITEFRVEIGGGQLAVFSVNNIFLPVQEPVWDFVLSWVRHDSDDLLNL